MLHLSQSSLLNCVCVWVGGLWLWMCVRGLAVCVCVCVCVYLHFLSFFPLVHLCALTYAQANLCVRFCVHTSNITAHVRGRWNEILHLNQSPARVLMCRVSVCTHVPLPKLFTGFLWTTSLSSDSESLQTDLRCVSPVAERGSRCSHASQFIVDVT